MSTSVSSVVSHFPSPQNGFTTTTSGSVGSGATSVGLNSVAGYTNGQVVVFVIDPTDTNKKQTFTGIMDTSGSQVTSVVWTAGTNQTHALGATVVDYATATHIGMMTKGIRVHANQDGTLITQAVRDALNLDSGTSTGWTVLGYTLNTVTANGNRSYTCTFNSNDLTSTLSAGMRLRTTRTVSAPTQCTSLNGTTQYYTKSSPAGMGATDNITVMGWIKPTAYQLGVIAARKNGTTDGWVCSMLATGQLFIGGARASDDTFTSYQSVPLNKWSHIAITINSAGAVGTVYIDGVSVPGTFANNANSGFLTPTGTFSIGADSAGGSPFAGKLAQVAVFSAVLSQATIQSYISQGLSGSETSLISAYSFNNSINDLSANANNLTANGAAVATNADSPFGTQASGLISATLDYGIIQSVTFSTNTTVVVQVPEGCTIPTSGGVSAVSYSTQKVPYGMPVQKGKWEVVSAYAGNVGPVSISSLNQWFPLLGQLTVPIGEMELEYQIYTLTNAATSIYQGTVVLAPATPTNAVRSYELVSGYINYGVTTFAGGTYTKKGSVSLSAATVYSYYGDVITNSGATTMAIRGDLGYSTIKAIPTHL